VAFLAVHERPPAVDVGRGCVVAAMCLLFINLVAWVARDGARFGREERLFSFVTFVAILMGWYAATQGIGEAAFDYRASVQQHELEQAARALSHELLAFVDARQQLAPPQPQPDSWEDDERRWVDFEQETILEYNARFALRVRATRGLFSVRSLRDPDLERVFQAPSQSFQIRAIAERLATLADRLERTNVPARF
jgi:hypothetical protein